MKMSLLLMFLFVLIVAGNDDLRRIDSIKHEQPCMQSGGFCVISADCPKGGLSKERGLCPTQQKEGIECCYGISVKETRCKQRGGECFSKAEFNCSESVRYDNPSDCNAHQICCILVK